MLEPVVEKLFGPVQLYVVVPEADVPAVMVVDGFVQVNTPKLVGVAVTVIPDTVQGPVSLNTSYCSI